jgi:oligopeptide/dipeptide ABC transporter ATP-binding protein
MVGAALLEIENLKKFYPVKGGVLRRVVGYVKAVDGVTLSIHPGETVGLVGESGCGKSTLGKAVMRLISVTDGRITFKGKDLLSMRRKTLRMARREIQMIFQDPYASLDPRMTVIELVEEPLIVHGIIKDKGKRRERAAAMLSTTGLSSEFLHRYPFELSGGQRQRVGIARALVVEPSLVIADEAVSALDVSVQAQVINLLKELRKRLNLTFLFIAHDLAVIKHISDRVAVMYLGKIVELATKKALFDFPMHPYTQALISAIPIPDPFRKSERIILQGDVPSPLNPPSGCRFHPRCPKVMPICSREEPRFLEHGGEHSVACHLYT